MSARRNASLLSLAVIAFAGCDYSTRIHGAKNAHEEVAPPPTKPTAVASVNVPTDALSKRPDLAPPKAFTPQKPVEFVAANGIHVWLLERPSLPIVTASFVVPIGIATDPTDKPGLSNITVDMMDEGAGKRGAVEVSTAIADLGASLSLTSSLDSSQASVSSLKTHFDEAFGILADVVARPHLDDKEWKRVSGLWKNSLKKRADDPGSVAALVASAALYGRDTPYGHPGLGLVSKAENVKIDDVRRFYHGMFRPDRVTLVIGGQITRPEVEALISKDLGDWKAEGDALTATPPTPPLAAATRPKVILVDRPGAVQSVISVVRDGLPVTAPERPLVDLINTALGGSFTSRLNENLREKHGWTYGAGSAFTTSRAQGMFTVRTAVEADFTGPSALEIKKELAAMSKDGLSADELAKVKAQDRADLVELYETLGSATNRLATFNALGLAVDHDATATAERQKATLEELLALAKSHVDPSACTFVIVGDAKKVLPQLEQAGFEKPMAYTVEGLPE